jgi:hypothetical protein
LGLSEELPLTRCVGIGSGRPAPFGVVESSMVAGVGLWKP